MKPASRSPGLVAAAAGYFAAQGLVMVGGFLSMPITTRLLSKGEYGILNLVFASIGMMVVIGQLGFPQAATRFYAERRQEGERWLRNFCENMIGGALVAGSLIALAAALAAGWMAGAQRPHYAECLRLGASVVLVRVVSNVIYQFFRADERVATYSVARIGARYTTLALLVAFLLLREPTAYQVILATLVGEGIVAIVCIGELAIRGLIRRPSFSWPTIRMATAYGVPLAAAGGATFILDYGDRFLIEHFFGLQAVATYAVPYDLAQNLAAATFGPIRLAVIPIVFRLWAGEGQDATSRFLSKVLTYMVALAIPISVLFVLMNKELIVLLASSKYGDSAALTPWLLPGVLMGEMNFLLASGLTLQKTTLPLAVFVLGAGALNVVLNLLLLPHWGLVGAAAATTASYAGLMAATYLKSRPVLKLRLHGATIGKALAVTGVMVVVVVGIEPMSHQVAVDLVVRGAVGAGIAAASMALLDRDVRGSWLRVGGLLRRRTASLPSS